MKRRSCGIFFLLLGLYALPFGWVMAGATGKTAASSPLHAVALSYDGQHLAWIDPHDGGNRLMLASWSGKDAHALALPEACDATGFRWSSDWNWLAVAGRCGNNSIIWLKDVQADKPLHTIARVPGRVACLQWSSDDQYLVYLHAPDMTRPVNPESVCRLDPARRGSGAVTKQQLVMVPVQGQRTPVVLSPHGDQVYAFRLSPKGHRVAYTVAGSDTGSRLYVRQIRADDRPRLLVDTARVQGDLHAGIVVNPQWSPSSVRILFQAAPAGTGVLAGRDVFSIPASGGTAVSLTAGNAVKPTWFRFLKNGVLLATQINGGKVDVVGYVVNGGVALQAATWFTVDSVIGDGREPLAVSLVYLPGRRPTVAYAQRSSGQPVQIHAGVFMFNAPPVVAEQAAVVQVRH